MNREYQGAAVQAVQKEGAAEKPEAPDRADIKAHLEKRHSAKTENQQLARQPEAQVV